MIKLKDYNKKMLSALHSVFWYEGLLEQYEDEWVEFQSSKDNYPFSRPKYRDDCFLIMFIKALREYKNDEYFTFRDVEKISVDFELQTRHTVIWQMLVEMFGSCGTSPRTGWIEQREECAKFLEQVVCIEELMYEQGEQNENR
jgi:hypothetical protein